MKVVVQSVVVFLDVARTLSNPSKVWLPAQEMRFGR
jgi:predicted mannosyl-3-phosphoglycerate phosphatase (HAD superfamily)